MFVVRPGGDCLNVVACRKKFRAFRLGRSGPAMRAVLGARGLSHIGRDEHLGLRVAAKQQVHNGDGLNNKRDRDRDVRGCQRKLILVSDKLSVLSRASNTATNL